MLLRGYRVGDLSVVYPLSRGTGPLLATTGAMALFGERPTPLSATGVLLVLAGVAVMTQRRSAEARARTWPGVRYGLGLGVVVAVYTLWDGWAVKRAGVPPLVFYWAGEVVRVALIAPLVGTSGHGPAADADEHAGNVEHLHTVPDSQSTREINFMYYPPDREVLIAVGTYGLRTYDLDDPTEPEFLAELGDDAIHGADRRDVFAGQHERAAGAKGDRKSVGARLCCRRVDQDDLELALELEQQDREGVARQQLERVRRARAGREHRQRAEFRNAHDGRAIGAAGQHRSEADRIVDLKDAMLPRPAERGVDQQRLLAELRERQRDGAVVAGEGSADAKCAIERLVNQPRQLGVVGNGKRGVEIGLERKFPKQRQAEGVDRTYGNVRRSIAQLAPARVKQQRPVVERHLLELRHAAEDLLVLLVGGVHNFDFVADAAQEGLVGERRRVEIARSLAIQPTFLLLDEPFSGIDPIQVLEIQRIVFDLKRNGIGILITDHNVRETLAVTDRAYIINNGKIFRAGSPEALRRDPEVKRVYLGETFDLGAA